MLIVLVEDDGILRRDMEEVLTQKGYQVKSVGSMEGKGKK